MNRTSQKTSFFVVMIIGIVFNFTVLEGHSHCDSMDGPVVIEAKAALESSDIKPLLKWVNQDQEEQVIEVFQKVVKIRSQSDEIREVADRYFFETLVRLHRESEGVSFTGIKLAGQQSPAITKADISLERGSVDELAKQISHQIDTEINNRFHQAWNRKQTENLSVKEGREFVKQYVRFMHFIEYLHHGLSHHVEEGHELTSKPISI